MTIVVSYTPTPPGRAALVAAAGVAAERNQPVIVVNSSRGDALADPASPRKPTSTGPGPRWKRPASSSASASPSGPRSLPRRC